MVAVGTVAGTWATKNPVLTIGLAIVTMIVLGVCIDRIRSAAASRRLARRAAEIPSDAPTPQSALEPQPANLEN